jgi:acyl dehydratase
LARIDACAELAGGYTRKSHFGQRVAHGLMGQSVADGLNDAALRPILCE